MPITIKEAQLKYKDPNTGDYVPVAAIADYSDIDVRVNGTSVMNDGIANIPVASSSDFGVFKVGSGLYMASNGILVVNEAAASQIKQGTAAYRAIVPEKQHESAFYGLAKAAGADMASIASVTVGQYPDTQKIAIQKMLGIYEAPWELIREDTFTNATEAEYTISADGNGNAFQLTDVVLIFTVPTQANTAVVGGYGRVYYYNGNTNIRTQYLYANASLTINANSGSYAAISVIEQNKGLMKSYWMEYRSQASHGYWQSVNGSDADGVQTSMGLKDTYIDSIKIAPFTGTMNYRLLGKRKWD